MSVGTDFESLFEQSLKLERPLEWKRLQHVASYYLNIACQALGVHLRKQSEVVVSAGMSAK